MLQDDIFCSLYVRRISSSILCNNKKNASRLWCVHYLHNKTSTSCPEIFRVVSFHSQKGKYNRGNKVEILEEKQIKYRNFDKYFPTFSKRPAT